MRLKVERVDLNALFPGGTQQRVGVNAFHLWVARSAVACGWTEPRLNGRGYVAEFIGLPQWETVTTSVE